MGADETIVIKEKVFQKQKTITNTLKIFVPITRAAIKSRNQKIIIAYRNWYSSLKSLSKMVAFMFVPSRSYP